MSFWVTPGAPKAPLSLLPTGHGSIVVLWWTSAPVADTHCFWLKWQRSEHIHTHSNYFVAPPCCSRDKALDRCVFGWYCNWIFVQLGMKCIYICYQKVWINHTQLSHSTYLQTIIWHFFNISNISTSILRSTPQLCAKTWLGRMDGN